MFQYSVSEMVKQQKWRSEFGGTLQQKKITDGAKACLIDAQIVSKRSEKSQAVDERMS